MDESTMQPEHHAGETKGGMKKLRTLGAVAIAIVAIVIIGAVAMFSGVVKTTSGAADVAKQFVELSAAGDYEAVYNLTNADFREVTSQEDLEGFIEDNAVLANATSVTFNIRQTENELYIVSGTLYADAEQSPITVHLTKDEDEVYTVLFFSLLEEDVPSLEDDTVEEDVVDGEI